MIWRFVETLVHIVKNPKTHKPFFAANFNSKFTKATKDAIVAFQTELNLAAAPLKPAPPPKRGAAKNASATSNNHSNTRSDRYSWLGETGQQTFKKWLMRRLQSMRSITASRST